MKVSSCLNPQRVYNKYSKEYVHVACGKCSECLKRKSLEWTERLTQERYCWRYAVFFTLTYSQENLPTLSVVNHGKFAYDLTHKHYHPEFGDVVIDLEELYSKLDPRDIYKSRDWIKRNGDKIGYLSVGDAQRFIKRFRINLDRLVKSQIKIDKQNGIKTILSDADSKVRYYLCGEYGETTLRPHFHGLFFFNSEFAASHIAELISKSWSFGSTDTSFVAESNASYVAGYVNCTCNLPQVLLHKRIRPFALFSKRPFIGSLCHSSEEVKKIFFEASPNVVIFDHKQSVFKNVPLWRSYQRKLYPKLSRFSNLSHIDRVALYRAFERFEKITEQPNFHLFQCYVFGHLNGVYTPSLYVDYSKEILGVNSLSETTSYMAGNLPILSWYYTSMRVCEQARSFGIPVRIYVSIIERFYNNCDVSNLNNQYEYENDLVEKSDLDSAFALDREFVRTICNLELQDLDAHEIDVLKSFGINVKKFYSEDPVEREFERSSYLPQSCREFEILSMDSEIWLKKHTKSKKKNDYLMAHPELGNILWCDDE